VRVTLITPGFAADDADWGMPAVRNLVTGLARRADVNVLALHYPFRRGPYEVDGVRVHALGGANVRGARRVALLLRAIRWARGRPADVVHGLFADEAGAVAVATGVRAVVSVLGGELVALEDIGYGGLRSRIGRRLLPVTLHRADRVTAGSAAVERLVAPYAEAERLPLGVDTGLFRPEGPRAPIDGLLCVASLTPVKGHDALLRALAVVPGAHLHLVGDGPLRGELERAAKGLAVTFHGHVAHQRLPEYYRAADLLVVPSRYESQCMVALEALACGCPVAGTEVGLLPELPGVTVVPAARLADAMRGPGSASLPDEYRLERTVERILELYREVTS
jgi:glycosyltransferase involved in cell wall biosynthesis